ncbi:MAG: helix-turn-helix domain-containing protein [Bacillota bacterium]|nr:helix-turn-helix domain-containing protein [Bacillota bacterium]
MIMEIKSYLAENIDTNVKIKPWQGKNDLPIFLKELYNFHEIIILEIPCILVEIVDELPDVDMLQKHIKRIKNFTDLKVVFYYKDITRYRRKSLIQHRIPFLIEGGQMYLPFLGLDLNKETEEIENQVEYFSPSTQLVYLYFLYHRNTEMSATDFSKKLKFTKMTASRALRDLYNANLLTYEIGGKTGRTKKYKRISDPDYFVNGQPYIKSPINKIVYVKVVPIGALIAGLDSLSKISMLNPPDHPIRAMGLEEFRKKKISIIKNMDQVKDEKLIQLQLWDYNPKLFSDNQHIDLLSLYATLKSEKDERIEQALEEVLRGERWYMD